MQTNKPLFSIIIPTLNEEKIIESTLRNIYENLSLFPYELIVADSGSSDATVEIAKKYATVLGIEKPSGKTIAWNRNRGAENATGDFFVFIDADVIIPNPDSFFKNAIDIFSSNEKIIAITVKQKVFPEVATSADNIIFGIVNFAHRFNNNFLHSGSASGEFQMIRSDAFKKLNGFQEHLAVAEDNDMFARLAKNGRTYMSTSLFVYHTARRPHTIGWHKVLWAWGINQLYVKLFNKSYNKEWKVIR